MILFVDDVWRSTAFNAKVEERVLAEVAAINARTASITKEIEQIKQNGEIFNATISVTDEMWKVNDKNLNSLKELTSMVHMITAAKKTEIVSAQETTVPTEEISEEVLKIEKEATKIALIAAKIALEAKKVTTLKEVAELFIMSKEMFVAAQTVSVATQNIAMMSEKIAMFATKKTAFVITSKILATARLLKNTNIEIIETIKVIVS